MTVAVYVRRYSGSRQQLHIARPKESQDYVSIPIALSSPYAIPSVPIPSPLAPHPPQPSTQPRSDLMHQPPFIPSSPSQQQAINPESRGPPNLHTALRRRRRQTQGYHTLGRPTPCRTCTPHCRPAAGCTPCGVCSRSPRRCCTRTRSPQSRAQCRGVCLSRHRHHHLHYHHTGSRSPQPAWAVWDLLPQSPYCCQSWCRRHPRCRSGLPPAPGLPGTPRCVSGRRRHCGMWTQHCH